MFFIFFNIFSTSVVDQNLDPSMLNGARQLETPDLSAGAESPRVEAVTLQLRPGEDHVIMTLGGSKKATVNCCHPGWKTTK